MNPMQDSMITVRLEPRTRFFAILLAKRAGLTLSEFVESCIDSCLQFTSIDVDGKQLSYSDLQQQLWAEHPADRFVRIAVSYPSELTLRERKLWNSVIRMVDEFWKVPAVEQRDTVTDETFRFDRLRDRWDEFETFDRNDVAALAKAAKRQRIAEWSKAAIPQQRALLQEQQVINEIEAKPARKSRRKE